MYFALPDDELGQALDHRRLHRNFMGYTAHRMPNMIGLGLSAIGEVNGAYTQNVKKLNTYYRALDAGRLSVEKGYVLNRDDRVRRHVITTLMCNGYMCPSVVNRSFNIQFGEYFARELAELEQGAINDGLLEIEPDALRVTPLGRIFIRNICMVFDRYLREKKREQPVFSRTV